MANRTEYFVNNLKLRVWRKSLVVDVHEMKDIPPHQDLLSDLPAWVFHSARTIWLAEGQTTMRGAIDGEKIKNKLMSELKSSSKLDVRKKRDYRII